MKKEQTKSNKSKEKTFIKAQSNLRCGQSQAEKIAAFKRGFFKRD
ncbi:hypothetical protein MHK_007302 [Candidatus Magnetomorum sp. HK-1]|nr:hypothetical protein MHK_007302 [Candidatus Magnetomorum sp. HK-1]